MKVKCINDSGLPSDLPKSKHVVKGNTYEVEDTFTAQPQNIPCFVLEEIDLTGEMYKGFGQYRFEIVGDDLQEQLDEIELTKYCEI